VGRRSRKRAAAGKATPARRRREPERRSERAARSRSEARNAAARAALEPLEEGERPTAVTVAALVALALAAANLTAHFAGVEFRDRRQPLAGVASYSAVMLVAAWGMWRARYWAVLGMQALLGILILIFSVFVLTAENVTSVLIALAVIVPAGTLFWFLVKAMARIQMPERRRS
jgi:peptidoglycan/LPS O-acetylase OafA/YrhL